MPVELVSLRVRKHPHEERTPSGVVSWTERVKRVNERVRGRPKADQRAQWNQVELCNWAWETEMKRWADEIGKSVIKHSELRHESFSFLRKNGLSLEFWAEEIATLLENPSILNQQSTRTAHGWSEKEREFIVSRRQMTETIGFQTEQDNHTTRNEEGVGWSSNLNMLIILLSWIRDLFCYFGRFLTLIEKKWKSSYSKENSDKWIEIIARGKSGLLDFLRLLCTSVLLKSRCPLFHPWRNFNHEHCYPQKIMKEEQPTTSD